MVEHPAHFERSLNVISVIAAGVHTKLPGPPVARALPDPTNKPAPIAPPTNFFFLALIQDERAGGVAYGYHLHVSALLKLAYAVFVDVLRVKSCLVPWS
jgi:hypothetical protein